MKLCDVHKSRYDKKFNLKMDFFFIKVEEKLFNFLEIEL